MFCCKFCDPNPNKTLRRQNVGPLYILWPTMIEVYRIETGKAAYTKEDDL